MSLLGIDVGTSGCKAVLFTETGEQIAAAYEEYDVQSPQPGWAELNSGHVWAQVKRTICKACAEARHDPPRALAVSSLGEAVVPVTRNRQILGPSLLNFDRRGIEFLPALRASILETTLYQVNGNTIGNHYSLTKLRWIKAHQPNLYHQADFFLHWGALVSFMLGAEPLVDYTLANRTLLFDLERATWSESLLEWAQVDREKLPPAIASGAAIGRVEPAIAAELGLPGGTLIVSGGHDQGCNALGCGVIEPGQAFYGMGTYLCMVPVFAHRPEAAKMIAQGLNTEHHVIPGLYVSFIYNQGGALVKWFRDTFAAAERQQAAAAGIDPYPALFAEIPAGPSRVLALPHFTATGPPRFIANSAGVLAGLRLGTTRGEILKGLIDSATFYLRQCFEGLPEEIVVSGFRAAGGGSKADAWMQASADIFGRPFMRPQVSEAGALGAAILAGIGSGVFKSFAEGVTAMVKPGRLFEPDPAMQARYFERFEKYRRLEPLLEDYLKDWDEA
ncbi:MAG TPA: FGGY-family carbohydrate kinase [Anaerolineaceae bacterium]